MQESARGPHRAARGPLSEVRAPDARRTHGATAQAGRSTRPMVARTRPRPDLEASGSPAIIGRMDPKHFRYHEEDGVAVVRLDRPERLNALTFASYRELTDAFHWLRTRDQARAVLLTGTGRAFCSGGDQKDIIANLLESDP
ncbi:MAG: hypothetical protein RIR65_1825, partial [Planctomycetota bacterium]